MQISAYVCLITDVNLLRVRKYNTLIKKTFYYAYYVLRLEASYKYSKNTKIIHEKFKLMQIMNPVRTRCIYVQRNTFNNIKQIKLLTNITTHVKIKYCLAQNKNVINRFRAPFQHSESVNLVKTYTS